MTIGRLVNAFFRWEFNSCETLIKDGVVYPIDYANACPDVAITSLHYYFPWAMKALVKWSVFCTATGRRPRYDLDTRRYFDIADRDDLSYDEKLAAYRTLADDYFEVERYNDFCASRLAHLDEVALEWFAGPEFDRLLVDTVRTTFPPHEHDHFIAHYRGLLGAWVNDERARLVVTRLRSGPLAAWMAAWYAGDVGPGRGRRRRHPGRRAASGRRTRPRPRAAARGADDVAAGGRSGAARAPGQPGTCAACPGPPSSAPRRSRPRRRCARRPSGSFPRSPSTGRAARRRRSCGTPMSSSDAPVDHLQLGDVSFELTTAIREAAVALSAADVAGGAADITEALRNARRAGEHLNLPPKFPPRAVALLAQAERMQAVLDLAADDPAGGAIDRFGMSARASALRPLAAAVRRARLAGYNAAAEVHAP